MVVWLVLHLLLLVAVEDHAHALPMPQPLFDYPCLQLIRGAGCKAGLVLTPSTSLEYCRYVMDKLDIILLMRYGH